MRIAVLIACAAAVTSLATGCGNYKAKTYPAGGRVTFQNGTEVTSGTVSFRPLEGELKTSARGEIQPDGSFELTTFTAGDGALPGRHEVLVAGGLRPPRRGDTAKPHSATIDT
jgi:hypothetical protein